MTSGVKAAMAASLSVLWFPLSLSVGIVSTSTHRTGGWLPFEQDGRDDNYRSTPASWADQPFTVSDAA
jgi:hypothetical protein